MRNATVPPGDVEAAALVAAGELAVVGAAEAATDEVAADDPEAVLGAAEELVDAAFDPQAASVKPTTTTDTAALRGAIYALHPSARASRPEHLTRHRPVA